MSVASPIAGTTRFARYAFMPNRLRYCGSDDNTELMQYARENVREEPLDRILRTFTGALPYLQLIAGANGIADPFDERVVEAYWIGNALLERVEARDLHRSLAEKYGGRVTPRMLALIAAKAPAGARPHHSFHVLDVWRHAERVAGDVLRTIDSCRISWGTVRSVEGGELVVDRPPLVLVEGALALGAARAERVTRLVDGNGFATDVAPGDIVSLHWGWVCERIDEPMRAALDRYTRHHVRIANSTLA